MQMRSWATPGKETGIHREHMAPPADDELSLAVDTKPAVFRRRRGVGESVLGGSSLAWARRGRSHQQPRNKTRCSSSVPCEVRGGRGDGWLGSAGRRHLGGRGRCGCGGCRAKKEWSVVMGVARHPKAMQGTARRPLGPGGAGRCTGRGREGQRARGRGRGQDDGGGNRQVGARRQRADEHGGRRDTHFSGVTWACLADPEPTTGCLAPEAPAPEAGRLSRAGRCVLAWRAGLWP